MNYALLSKWIEGRVEELVAMGVSREVAERELQGVEWAAVQDLAASHRDSQLLLNLERYGTAATAERYGKSARTITNWRTAAINRKFSRRPVAEKTGTI